MYELWLLENYALKEEYLPLRQSLYQLIDQIEKELEAKGVAEF